MPRTSHERDPNMLFSLLVPRRGEPQPLQSGATAQSDACLTPPGPVEEEELDEEEWVVGDMDEERFVEEGEGGKVLSYYSLRLLLLLRRTTSNKGGSLRYPIYYRYLLILRRVVSWVKEGR